MHATQRSAALHAAQHSTQRELRAAPHFEKMEERRSREQDAPNSHRTALRGPKSQQVRLALSYSGSVTAARYIRRKNELKR